MKNRTFDTICIALLCCSFLLELLLGSVTISFVVSKNGIPEIVDYAYSHVSKELIQRRIYYPMTTLVATVVSFASYAFVIQKHNARKARYLCMVTIIIALGASLMTCVYISTTWMTGIISFILLCAGILSTISIVKVNRRYTNEADK